MGRVAGGDWMALLPSAVIMPMSCFNVGRKSSYGCRSRAPFFSPKSCFTSAEVINHRLSRLLACSSVGKTFRIHLASR